MYTSYDNLPLGVYLDVLAVCADESRDEVSRQVGVIALLAGMSEDEVLTMPIAQYKAMAGQLSFLEVAPQGTVASIGKVLQVGDWTLRPVQSVADIITAQYIDFETYAKGGIANLPQILSAMLVPDGCRYGEGYDVAQLQADLRERMTTAVAVELCAFFFGRLQTLIRGMQIYFKWAARMTWRKAKREKMRKARMALEDLGRAGDGWRRLMAFPTPVAVRGTGCLN